MLIIVYCIFGALFFSFFHSDSFWLVINGNGGFFGNFINNGFTQNEISPLQHDEEDKEEKDKDGEDKDDKEEREEEEKIKS